MNEQFYICYYMSFVESPATPVTSVVEFVFVLFVILCGLFLNVKFWRKLKDDRRNVPVGRRGNIVEPIMRFFCVVQILFWPLNLLYNWINTNEIIPEESMPAWLCYTLWNTMTLGRSYIAYNSFFVALLRYLYIVHQEQANTWDFEMVGRRFLLANIIIPGAFWSISLFTHDPVWLQSRKEFKDCVAFQLGKNVTDDFEFPPSAPVKLTRQYIPTMLIQTIDFVAMITSALAFLNIAELFLYHQIFRTIRRYLKMYHYVKKLIFIFAIDFCNIK